MNSRFKELSEWIDQKSTRERAFLVVAVAATAFTLWSLVLMGPLRAYRTQLRGELDTAATNIRMLKTRVEALVGQTSADPNEENRRAKEELERELARLDAELESATIGLIRPDEMAGALRELLRREKNLRLVRLETQAAEPLFAEDDEPEPGQHTIFRHGIVIELRGDYMSTLRYMEAIESLPWRFFWDQLEYEVQTYPEARIVLSVHSLSAGEGWIGV